MKNLFKIAIFLLLTIVIFESCTSDKFHEEIVSEEQRISSGLTDKIIATATSKSELSIINPQCNPTTLSISSLNLSFYFRNPQGDYYSSNLPITDWTTGYEDAKKQAYEETGIRFTDDDFFIRSLLLPNAAIVTKTENIIDYFEDCEYVGGTDYDFADPYFSVSISEVNFDCDASVTCQVPQGQLYLGEQKQLSEVVDTIEDELVSYNTLNNTFFSMEDIRVTNLTYTSPAGTTGNSIKREEILNYFEDCMLSRDATVNDCLNFVYPLEINRFNLRLEEVITTIESDEDLTNTFTIDTGELGFVYPISLLGKDGSTVEINNNEDLENALDDSAMYCN